MKAPFTPDEQARYSRHFSVSAIGMEGQAKLKQASVLLIGAGGIGSPAALYLASCGVGTLGIIDHDIIEVSNLQRQILFSTTQCGQSKARCAGERLQALNPNVQLNIYSERLSEANAETLIAQYDVILDGSDNYATRYRVGDASAVLHKPLISASIFQFLGQLSVLNWADGPCYRCLYPTPPPKALIPNCAEAGVLGVIPGILGTLAVNEVLKIILGIGKPLSGVLATFDALTATLQHYAFPKNARCPLCVEHRSLKELPRYDDVEPVCQLTSIRPQELAAWQQAHKPVTIVDVRESWELAICQLPNSLHIPLGQIADAPLPFGNDSTVITVCHAGVRSQKAAEVLRKRGYPTVYSLEGGVAAWAKTIDPSMATY